MANPHNGEVSFKAGTEQFTLRFSANAICEMEDKLALNINKIGDAMRDPETLRMSFVRTMFCIGLVDSYRETRPELDEQMAVIVFSRLTAIDGLRIVTQAFSRSFGAEETAAAENPQQPGPSNGHQTAPGTGPASTNAGVA